MLYQPLVAKKVRNMTDSADFEALFDLAQEELKHVTEEFAAYGVQVKPGLEVRRAEEPAYFYDAQSGHIYIFIPTLGTFTGILYTLFLASLFGCDNNQELIGIFRLWIPFLIAHEVAHSVRDYYGLASTDLWAEEQVANQFAAAMTKRRVPPIEKAQAVARLTHLIEELKRRMGVEGSAPDAYYNLLDALGRDGKLGRWAVDDLQIIQRAFSISPEEMLTSSGELAEGFLQRREMVIAAFNHEYASNLNQYAYYQFSCLYYELISRESNYVEALIRLYLQQQVELLPTISIDGLPEEAAIRGCYHASRLTINLSETASRYFYKRYRSLLLARLRVSIQRQLMPARSLNEQAIRVLEPWEEEDADVLMLLEQVIPASIHHLLPHRIKAAHDDQDNHFIEASLPDQTDQRLWRHVFHHEADGAAAATLLRLLALDRADILRGLPAEVLLELSHLLVTIKLGSGETLIWEGEIGNDLYIVSIGELAVYSADKRIAVVAPGGVVGEIAFFTREPRTATVRATIQSECFVLKAYDFHLMGLRYPSILMQMSRFLAGRLLKLRAQANQTTPAAPQGFPTKEQ